MLQHRDGCWPERSLGRSPCSITTPANAALMAAAWPRLCSQAQPVTRKSDCEVLGLVVSRTACSCFVRVLASAGISMIPNFRRQTACRFQLRRVEALPSHERIIKRFSKLKLLKLLCCFSLQVIPKVSEIHRGAAVHPVLAAGGGS